MIDSTDARRDRGGAQAHARARRSSTRSTSRTARSASSGRAARAALRRGAGGRLHRRGQAAGHGGHTRSASSRSPSARYKLLTEKYGVAPEDIIFDPLVFPVRHRRRATTSAPRSRRSRASALIKAALPATARPILGISNVSFGLPAGGPRGAELGLPLPLREGRPRPRDRQLREARALPVDPRGGAPARRGPDLVARRRSGRRLRRAFPRAQGQARRRAAKLAAAGRAARPATSWRARRRGSSRTSTRRSERDGRSRSSTAR